MPSRNRIKIYIPNTYYHIYNRGINKRKIFLDEEDYSVYLKFIERYLSKKPAKDRLGRIYEHLYGQIELLAFCLMPNHYHLLVYVVEAAAMTRLLRGVNTSYTTYFNKKYQRLGPLFQDRYKASPILNDTYLTHISRYIHLNPGDWKEWPFSSLPFYLGQKQFEWLKPNRILRLLDGYNYETFVSDYKNHKQMLASIRSTLADY